MSNTSFNFLADSFLFHEAEQGYKSRTLAELDDELNRYREYINEHQQEIDNEVSKKGINIIQDLERNSKLPTQDQLLQGCIFLDTYLVNDPVFDFNLSIEYHSNIARQSMGIARKSDDELKSELANYAIYMKSLTEGVRCDTEYIKFYPFGKVLRPESDYLFNLPDLSTDKIDKKIFSWFLEKVEVLNLNKDNQIDKQMATSNKIVLQFKNDTSSSVNIVQYQRMVSPQLNGNKLTFGLDYNYILSKDEYDNWVSQEKIKSIKDKLDLFLYRNMICRKFNSPLVLKNKFENEFFEMNFGDEKANNLYKLGFDLNFSGLKNMDFKKAMSVRREAKSSFKEFQKKIQKDSLILHSTKDKNEYKDVLDDIKQQYLHGTENVKSTLEISKDIVSSNLIPVVIGALSYFASPDPLNKVITGLSVLDLVGNIKKTIQEERRNPFYFLKKMVGSEYAYS